MNKMAGLTELARFMPKVSPPPPLPIDVGMGANSTASRFTELLIPLGGRVGRKDELNFSYRYSLLISNTSLEQLSNH